MKAEVTNILTNLLGAVKAVNYYPPKHPSRTQPVNRTHQLLKPLLAKRASVVLAIVEEVLVFDEQPFFDDANMHIELKDQLEERSIGAIIVHKGVTDEELGVLVEVLSADSTAMRGWGSINEYLATRNVSHISIEIADDDMREKARKVYSDAKSFIL